MPAEDPAADRPTVVIGDIGHRTLFHVGDEAMFDALVPGDRAPADWIAVSADPAHTTERTGVPAIPRLGFPAVGDPALRETRLAEVLGFAGADAPPPGDPAREVLAALDRAGGLLVSGGGNLGSAWPDHVYERVALIELATRRGIPAVVTGQTIGPELAGRDRELLAGALRQAALVGVREPDSHALALRLGVDPDRLALQLDDAIALGRDEPATDVPDGPWIAVTVPPLGTDRRARGLLEALAEQLAALAQTTGARIVVIPHEGSLDGVPVRDMHVGDVLASAIASRGAPVTAVGLRAPAAVAALTRCADLVVSARYHPLVFGLGGGVPCLGIHRDEYTRVRARGALGFAGLADWSLPLDAATEVLAQAGAELWDRRAEVCEHLGGVLPGWREASVAHAARVLRALRGGPSGGADVIVAPPGPAPRGSWVTAARLVDDVARRAEREHRDLRRHADVLERSFRDAERYALSLRAALDEAESRERRAPRTRRRRPAPDASPSPAPPPRIRFSDLRHAADGENAVASMFVEGGAGPSGRLHLRRHAATLDEIDRSATPFAPIAAVLAVAQGADAHIDGPVDETARAGAQTGAAQLAEWFGWRPPVVTAAGRADPAAPRPGVALCFSGGLDSMASLVRQRERVDTLIGMSWQDPPYREPGTDALWRGTVAAAAAAGLPLLQVSTDARTLLEPVVSWDFSHGAILAGCALLMTPALGEVLIAGAFPDGRAAPAGTHQDLDHHWSSSAVRFATESGGGGRNEKAAIVGRDAFASRWLNVCWQNPGERNCGRCCKCLLTMTNFKIAGTLEAVRDRFDGELTPEAVYAVAYEGLPTTPMNAELIIERLDPEDPLRPAWERMREVALMRDPATQRQGPAGASDA